MERSIEHEGQSAPKLKRSQELKSPSAREIADRVSMPELLRQLGFEVNESTHRARCVLHDGDNPTAFSWTEDGRWHCFSCGQGGDKYALVQAALRCDFREAVQMLARLAGGEINFTQPSRQALFKHRKEEGRLQAAARNYESREREVRSVYRDWLRTLDLMEQIAATRLAALMRGGPRQSETEERKFPETFHMALNEKPSVAAAFYILSFASEDDRQRFVLYPAERHEWLDRALEHGGVKSDNGHFVEIVL